MSMISELVDTLRILSELQNKQHHERIINRAADTIESLSAKLQVKEYCDGCPGADITEIPCTEECKRRHFKAENMQRSAEDCGGGWIKCKDRLPETRNNILVCQSDGYVSVGYYSWDRAFLDLNSIPFDDVIAWRELPEPYHEP